MGRWVMAIEPAKIITTARTFINTPYRHQGRTPGRELDCIGVILLSAIEAGIVRKGFDIKNYPRIPDGSLARELDIYCEELKELTVGAIALFAMSKTPHHCGIITDYGGGMGLLHAYESTGVNRVVEHALVSTWKDKIVKLYAFPNVKY